MKLNRNSYIFIKKNAFESVICETAAILPRPQCVKLRIKMQLEQHRLWTYDFDAWLETESSVKSSNSSSIVLSGKILFHQTRRNSYPTTQHWVMLLPTNHNKITLSTIILNSMIVVDLIAKCYKPLIAYLTISIGHVSPQPLLGWLVPYHVMKSLKLIWWSGTCRWILRVLDHQRVAVTWLRR